MSSIPLRGCRARISTQPGFSLRLRHQVHALVHSIGEINVGVAGRSEDNPGAIGDDPRRNARPDPRPEIGFGLDYDSGNRAMHKNLSQQIARHLYRVAAIKGTRQNRPVTGA